MVVEGVTFIDDAVRSMDKCKFLDMHMNIVFKDRTIEKRREILQDIYDRITGIKTVK